MSDTPWTGDACSLVDAFRAGERSPVEELDASLAAIDASDLNASRSSTPNARVPRRASPTCRNRSAACPSAIKELEPVAGWPATEASLVFRDRVATDDVDRRRAPVRRGRRGAGRADDRERVRRPQRRASRSSTASRTIRGGTAVRPAARRPGSSAAVAGGLVTLATGGDGGGSIRIPAGYTGLLGMKGTFGRIPRAPHAFSRPNTVVLGNLARSVRDAARYYDVCAGYDPARPVEPARRPAAGRPASAPTTCAGRRVAILPDLGGVTTVEPGVEERVRDGAKLLIAATGLVEVDVHLDAPEPRGAVDDGQPLHAARRARRPVAALRPRPHRRGRDRPLSCRSRSTT